ncbi:hypothetical protein D3C75_884570 [compost metagenome]
MQADVLTGFGAENRTTIERSEVEGNDLAAFVDALHQLEVARTTPATRSGGFLSIDVGFGTDEDIGQLLVSSAPGSNHFRGGDFLAEHFFDGAQQAATDDRVMFRKDLQGHMLVDDLADQATELFELVDVPGVHQYTVGQGPRLVAAGLVRLVEQRAHLWVFAEHQFVEVSGQRLTAAFQQGNSGFDDCTILGIEHG